MKSAHIFAGGALHNELRATVSLEIHRGEEPLAQAVDKTLGFQVKLLERLGGELDGVVQIRAFMNTCRAWPSPSRRIT